MTVKCFTEDEKNIIVSQYLNNIHPNQQTLAEAWATSPRTINRILIERGYHTPTERLKVDAHQVMLVLKDYGIYSASELKDTFNTLLETPLLTPENVQKYLNECSTTTLLDHMKKASIGRTPINQGRTAVLLTAHASNEPHSQAANPA